HYANWMADHERPYLSHPEILEYPTETWAAQDIRKSEVFEYAARHADSKDRARFVERAEFFFEDSIRTLQAMPTRTLARPVVLLLGHGFRRAYTRHHGVAAAPVPRAAVPRPWPAPDVFVPQKLRAKRRAVRLAAIGTALGSIGLAYLALALLR